MQYLGLALYAEGPTDYRFLSPLLQRLCEEICLLEGREPVEVSDVLALDHPEELNKESRERRILAAAENAKGAWRILFIHADGESDPDAARRNQVDPALKLLQQRMKSEGNGIAVVPVHEMESRVLADAESLQQVFGTTLSARELGVPTVSLVEKERNPKAVLRRCFDLARPGARNRHQTEAGYFQTLGECVSMEALRRLPSFQRLEAELKDALRSLQIII